MKLLLLLFFNCTVCNLFAQFGTQGQKVLGGTLTFNSGNSSNSLSPEIKPLYFNVGGSVSVGKFRKTNTLNALSLSYNHGYTKNTATNNISRNYNNTVFISYGVTKYKELSNKLFLGIGGAGYIGYNNMRYYNSVLLGSGESDGINFGVYFFPIVSYQVSKRFVVNLTTSAQFLNMNYSISTAKNYFPNHPTTKAQIKNFNFDAGLFGAELKNLTIGFSYLLKNKNR